MIHHNTTHCHRARILVPVLLSMLLLVAASCTQSGGNSALPQGERIYTPRYAHGFAIDTIAALEGTLITVTDPWQGADGSTSQLLITDRREQVPSTYTGQVIAPCPQRIAVMSSTHVAIIEELDAAGRIKGVSGKQFIASRSFAAACPDVADLGYEGNVDYELLASLRPDLVLLYSVSGPSVMEPKLRELGIPYIYIADYLEQSPQGKAEWLVAVGHIMGLRDRAIEHFEPIPLRYNAIKEQVAVLDSAPAVMLNIPYRDVWYMPGSDTYMVRLITDAGGNYLCHHDKEIKPIDIEQALTLANRADVWLNVGDLTTLDQLTRQYPLFATSRCVATGQVYNNNHRATPGGGNDFFESATVHPDIVLRDLVNIFHPGLLECDTLVYYRKLEPGI